MEEGRLEEEQQQEQEDRQSHRPRIHHRPGRTRPQPLLRQISSLRRLVRFPSCRALVSGA